MAKDAKDKELRIIELLENFKNDIGTFRFANADRQRHLDILMSCIDMVIYLD